MKKLVLLSVLLCFVVGSWAQTATTADVTDEAYVRINVTFKGIELTVTAEDDPASNGLSEQILTATWGAWAVGTEDVAGDAVDRDLDLALPCGVIHQVLWIENTGGLNCDIDLDARYQRNIINLDDADWTLVANGGTPIACTGLTQDDYKFTVKLAQSTGDAGHVFTGAVDMSAAPHDDAWATLVAEDPDCPFPPDGTWLPFVPNGEDQLDLDIAIVLPPSIGCTDGDPDQHSIKLEITAEVDDD